MLPTLQHELVDGGRAVHRSRKPEGLVDGFHDLRKRPGQRFQVYLWLRRQTNRLNRPQSKKVLCSYVDVNSKIYRRGGGKLRWMSGNFQSPPTLKQLSGNTYLILTRTGQNHPSSQPGELERIVTDETYLVVAHVPVGSFAKCHDFPHHDAEAPHVAG